MTFQAPSEGRVGRFFPDLGPGLITGAADFTRYSLFHLIILGNSFI
jgi:hypothetical protein